MSTRSKPYDSSSKSWNDILEKMLNIPMNQREYSWNDKEIHQFISDIIKIFEEGKYFEKMGSIINLTYNGTNEIYDGQQRTITIILILYNISLLVSPTFGGKIISKLTLDGDMDELNTQQLKLKGDKNIDVVPKIYCINPFDMNALCDVFNGKCNDHFVSHIKYDEINELYICKLCDENIKDKSKVYRHLNKQHTIDCKIDIYASKIYSANESIYNYFKKIDYNEEKVKQLYRFIMNEIDIEFCSCTDPTYVSRIFDWENNRGNKVQVLDVVKNYILVQIEDSKKYEIYDKWEEYKNLTHNIYKNDYGKKVMDIAIQIYNHKIERKLCLDELYKPIIESDDTYPELIKYFKIIDDLHNIMKKIQEDRYGRLITHIKQVSITWEGYMYLFLPILYTIDVFDTRLIKLIVKWYFRNTGIKSYTFNSIGFSNKMINITNKVISDKNYDYYSDIVKLFNSEIDIRISTDNYINTLNSLNLKGPTATHLLMFLETALSNDIAIIPLDYTIEHIIPQGKIEDLQERKMMHNLGNLTLLEGTNSENKHKGNSSLGKKNYYDKKSSYSKSNSIITRHLVDDFNNFNESSIEFRCGKLSKLLLERLNYE